MNIQLSFDRIRKYRKEHILANNNRKCVICEIGLETSIDKTDTEMLVSAHKQEYVRLYSNIGTFNMPENTYLINCAKVVKNIVELRDIPKINRRYEGNMFIIEHRHPNIFKFLTDHNIQDVLVFEAEIIQQYCDGLQEEINKSTTSRFSKVRFN